MLYEKIDAKLSKNDEEGVIALLPSIPEKEHGNIACILEISIYKNYRSIFEFIINNYDIKKLNSPHESFYDAIFNRDFSNINDFEYFTLNLYNKSVDIYASNSNNETFIENIVFSENENKYEQLDCLIKNGITIKSNPLKDKTLLIRTMPYKNLFKYLFDNCPELVKEKSKKGNSFFITAVQNKKYELVEDIIKRDIIDINDRGYSKCTPLFFAVLNQDKKMLDILLEAGADVTIKNNKELDIFALQETLYTGFVSKRQNGANIENFNQHIKSLNKNKRTIRFK